ncbi:putative fmp21-like protein [Diaporthe ampelina]|uniref:Succinate dehydrogenase assembly factor 4, mitochondrial n=1 Tax=Diaporthe ampelina TaxID=1214573 RepID=A0A0G2F8H7_9PEZI|nr:putative fmp21-like protein [Diaporthe ampelina]
MPLIRLFPRPSSLRAIRTAPVHQQAEFERLRRAVADRLADPTPLPHEQQQRQPSVSPASTPRHTSTPDTAAATTTTTSTSSTAASSPPPPPPPPSNDDEPATGGVWRGARPEFDGERNPKTGEVGGPKTEPLRWGSAGDWSYNGRVTDF